MTRYARLLDEDARRARRPTDGCATGGLVGREVESDRDGGRDPVFDCHVPHTGDR